MWLLRGETSSSDAISSRSITGGLTQCKHRARSHEETEKLQMHTICTCNAVGFSPLHSDLNEHSTFVIIDGLVAHSLLWGAHPPRRTPIWSWAAGSGVTRPSRSTGAKEQGA